MRPHKGTEIIGSVFTITSSGMTRFLLPTHCCLMQVVFGGAVNVECGGCSGLFQVLSF